MPRRRFYEPEDLGCDQDRRDAADPGRRFSCIGFPNRGEQTGGNSAPVTGEEDLDTQLLTGNFKTIRFHSRQPPRHGKIRVYGLA